MAVNEVLPRNFVGEKTMNRDLKVSSLKYFDRTIIRTVWSHIWKTMAGKTVRLFRMEAGSYAVRYQRNNATRLRIATKCPGILLLTLTSLFLTDCIWLPDLSFHNRASTWQNLAVILVLLWKDCRVKRSIVKDPPRGYNNNIYKGIYHPTRDKSKNEK